MSTKKNLIFNVVLETSPLLQSIVLDHIVNFEETQYQKELEDLRELMRQKAEALALAELKASQKALEDQETQEPTEAAELGNSTTNSSLEATTNSLAVDGVISSEELLSNPLLSMELPSEESITEKYKVKINLLYQQD